MPFLRFSPIVVGVLVLSHGSAQDGAMTTVRLVVAETSLKSFPHESKAAFTCSKGHVLVGRRHSGDENGPTDYREASLKTDRSLVDGKDVAVAFARNHDIARESKHEWFRCPPGHVITGREHKGDETGPTNYQTAIVKVGGIECRVVDREEEATVRPESENHWHDAPEGKVMVGRSHTGDENGPTKYEWGRLEVDVPTAWLASSPIAQPATGSRAAADDSAGNREGKGRPLAAPERDKPESPKDEASRVNPWILAAIALLAAGGGAAAWLGLLTGKKRP